MSYVQNQYPNSTNFAELSFPEELIAPVIDPDDPDTNLYAYNPEWTKVLMAACDQLTQFTTWQGTHTEKILAVNRAIILKMLLQTPVTVGEREYPTPYWDNETDVDDEAPADEEDWYGKVTDAAAPADGMTFVQDAVVWLFTGFVALVASPTLVGAAAAAITFRTVAKRFVLAFNRGDIREQFRIIIDQTDYDTIDTDGMSEGDIIEVNIDGLEDTEEHEILIVVTNP